MIASLRLISSSFLEARSCRVFSNSHVSPVHQFGVFLPLLLMLSVHLGYLILHRVLAVYVLMTPSYEPSYCQLLPVNMFWCLLLPEFQLWLAPQLRLL